ncbi:MAG TPA: class I SAM-dependent methyltransferase [Aquifex aeolicus]|uniref:Class I SAM-dependent methyltransferase n=1 Tax=Aquifex aeolicus TaxID=63363 RepID=A0A7C5PZN7_AQUAO|nr:class I SAM-dependent methyltransferase [Aquifex aeolicus]
MRRIEAKAYWDKRYSKSLDWCLEPSVTAKRFLNYIYENNNFENRFKILDIGCGYGRDSIFIANFLRNSQIIGVDVSKVAIELATSLKNTLSLNNLLFIETDALSISDKKLGNSFDFVLSHLFIHLFDYKGRLSLYQKFKNLLKPKGLFFFSVPTVYDEEFRKGKCLGIYTYKNDRGVTKTFFNKDKITCEIQHHGFEVLHVYREKEIHFHSKKHVHDLFVVIGGKT